MGTVESGYHQGYPLHHLPLARQIDWDPHNVLQSSIFVAMYDDFKSMSPKTIQTIFRDRHILVLDAPLPSEDFSLKSLGELACTTIPIQMQGKVHSF